MKALSVPEFREETCPACGHHVAVPFFDGGDQPLATLAWPQSKAGAQSLPRYHLDFVRCVGCGHVYNAKFDYANVPYSTKPNLMFNQAANWSQFLVETQRDMMARLPESPTVVEIGHGDGSFLAALAKLRPQGRYFGFDPHGASKGAGNVTFRAELFDPARHMGELKPDLMISRHVLEHLVNPLGFLQSMSFAAASLDILPLAYFEVPCIDVAIRNRRTVDFYYEHSSQFTTNSFVRMMSRGAAEVVDIGHGYGTEVVFGFVRIGAASSAGGFVKESQAFAAQAVTGLKAIEAQLAELSQQGKRVAIWGGTGKSAAFMCRYGADAERFPLVVDSDAAKGGTFVP
ncbi:MAG: class I SAM-dependent methyltransferase, partial [Pseudolabrys sp.]|nr:class I SAM-dependent methyltransferase [Pseudolabrys sp.]